MSNNITFEVINRTIDISPDIVNIVVQGDTNSRVISFKLDRYFDGVDLSTKTIRVNYKLPDNSSDSDRVTSVIINDLNITCDWIITNKTTLLGGIVKFAIEIYDIDSENNYIYIWQTLPAEFIVPTNLKVEGNIIPYNYETEKNFYNIYGNKENLYSELKDSNESFLIQGRNIEIPEISNIAIDKDTYSQIITFKMQRYFESVDLYNKLPCIKFINPSGQGDRAFGVNKKADDKYLHFNWILDGKATTKAGKLQFAIEFIGYDEKNNFYCWQTLPASLTIDKGLYVDGMIPEPAPSWIQSWQIQADNVIKQSQDNADLVLSKVNEATEAVKQSHNDVVAASTLVNEAKESANLSKGYADTSKNYSITAKEQADIATQKAQEVISKIPPTKVSQLENDLKYQTESQVNTIVDTKIGGISQNPDMSKAINILDVEHGGTGNNSGAATSIIGLDNISYRIWRGTQAEYDALSKDNKIIYFIQ